MFSQRFFSAAVALVAAVFLVGFVPLPQKVLDQCRKYTVSGPATARASLDGVPGRLDIVAPGLHRFTPDAATYAVIPGEPQSQAIAITDPGPGRGGDLQPLWRALDFFSPLEGADLTDILRLSRIDITRRGWIRLDGEGDHLAVTLGAVGESDPASPQVWIDNESHRLVKVRLPDSLGGEATVGPSDGVAGWPWWIKLGDGRLLQLMSTPEPFTPQTVTVEYEDGTATDPLGWWRTLLVDEVPEALPADGGAEEASEAPETPGILQQPSPSGED
jgi:hypothetical protein